MLHVTDDPYKGFSQGNQRREEYLFIIMEYCIFNLSISIKKYLNGAEPVQSTKLLGFIIAMF